jgi:hypothetical protein
VIGSLEECGEFMVKVVSPTNQPWGPGDVGAPSAFKSPTAGNVDQLEFNYRFKKFGNGSFPVVVRARHPGRYSGRPT